MRCRITQFARERVRLCPFRGSYVREFELSHSNLVNRGVQLFEGLLALNPGLNLTRVSLSCVQKHFLG